MAGRPWRRYRTLQAELGDLDEVKTVILESKDARMGEAESFLAAVQETYNPAPKFGTEAAWRAEDERFRRSQAGLPDRWTKAATLEKAQALVWEIEDDYAEELETLEKQRASVLARMQSIRAAQERRGRLPTGQAGLAPQEAMA